MSKVLILLFVFYFLPCQAQSYIGSNNLNICLLQERHEDFLVWGFKTTLSKEPTLKMRVGFEYRETRLSAIIFLPILNLRLKTMTYNTPINAEFRYYGKYFLLGAGLEVHGDKPEFYINAFIPFNNN